MLIIPHQIKNNSQGSCALIIIQIIINWYNNDNNGSRKYLRSSFIPVHYIIDYSRDLKIII